MGLDDIGKLMKYLLLFLILPLFSFSQSKYESLGKTTDGTEYLINIDKLDLDTNTWSIWLKVSHPVKKIKNKKGKLISIDQGYQIQYMTFYCPDRQYDCSEYYRYNADGSVEESGNMYIFKSKIVPETVADMVFTYLCEEK